MKSSLIKKLFLLAGVLYLPLQSMAWGSAGHYITGLIAESYLTPQTRNAVRAILGRQDIAMSSDWADYIKTEPYYRNTSSWHYIDLNRPYTYPQLVNFLKYDKQADAYTKIQYFTAELRNRNLPKKEQLFALRMLIHLVEDVHQPMHVAHASDKGGNDFRVWWFNEPTNLHAVWDVKLIQYQRLSDHKYARWINHASPAQVSLWQNDPLSKWLYESNSIAAKLYNDIHPGDRLGYNYSISHINILNQQMLKAGIRLAGVLNGIFR